MDAVNAIALCIFYKNLNFLAALKALTLQRCKDVKVIEDSTIFQMPHRQTFIQVPLCFFIFFDKVLFVMYVYQRSAHVSRGIQFWCAWHISSMQWHMQTACSLGVKILLVFNRSSFPVINTLKNAPRKQNVNCNGWTMTDNTNCPWVVFDCLECFLSFLENFLVARQCYDTLGYVCYGATILYSTICAC